MRAPTDARTPIRRVGATALITLWGLIIAFAVHSSPEAGARVGSAVDQIETVGIGKYLLISILVLCASVFPSLVRRRGQAAIAPLAIAALAAASFLGVSRSGYDNSRVAYPTSTQGPSPLIELATSSPNGTIATQWATFIAAEEIIGGDEVVMPAGTADVAGAFEIYFTAMSGASVVEQTYEFNISPSNPAVSGTPVLDQDINADWRLTILGETERYVVFEAPGRIFLVATP